MTHDKPEPPDMRGEAYTLRQKIQDEIESLSERFDECFNGEEEAGHSGKIEAFEQVLGWIDEFTT